MSAAEIPLLTTEDLGIDAVSESSMPPELALMLAATLDVSLDLVSGVDLPLLWHWAFFSPTNLTAELGHDGHPRLPAGGPSQNLPRRMWAGGSVVRHRPLVIGKPATRRSVVEQAARKIGRSGTLLVVTIRHEIEQLGEVVQSEHQNLVYREVAQERIAAPAGDASPEAPPDGWARRQTVDAVQLFRFSAVTFNSHRIHVDREYATTDEGYPDLVVHGPLTALLLRQSCSARCDGHSRFEFRAAAPLFASTPFTIVGEPDGRGAIALSAVRNDGTVAMTAHSS